MEQLKSFLLNGCEELDGVQIESDDYRLVFESILLTKFGIVDKDDVHKCFVSHLIQDLEHFEIDKIKIKGCMLNKYKKCRICKHLIKNNKIIGCIDCDMLICKECENKYYIFLERKRCTNCWQLHDMKKEREKKLEQDREDIKNGYNINVNNCMKCKAQIKPQYKYCYKCNQSMKHF